MFGFLTKRSASEAEDRLAALDKSLAVIEFAPNGIILTANDNFLAAMGYSLDEIKGKHHRIFLEPSTANSREYADFWTRLGRGEFQAAQFRRFGKGGREIWIEATYNPILTPAGIPYKIVKYATDITKRKTFEADLQSQVNAIHKSQAVIEFTLDGTILNANANFLSVMGYSLDEIQGQHHRIFVERDVASSADYIGFWDKLQRGEFHAAQFRRVGKGGQEVWIEATYNPILNAAGKPYKVVKYATNITTQVLLLRNLKVLIDQNFARIERALQLSHELADTAGAATSDASHNVMAAAEAAEKLARITQDIVESMAKSQQTVNAAQAQATEANRSTEHLAIAAEQMGGIVEVIRNIASQINLLALNATIEAARAGEAGRGFAVVANEVKNLANQASRATDQISSEIDGIQTVSRDVVSSLSGIHSAIETVRTYVVNTGAAVSEQSTVAGDMSQNMKYAAFAVSAATSNIKTIAQSVEEVAVTVNRTRSEAEILVR